MKIAVKDLQQTIIKLIIGAVIGFIAKEYLFRQQILFDTQKNKAQEEKQKLGAIRRNVLDFNRTIKSMQFDLDQGDVDNFRKDARTYLERQGRKEFDLATSPIDGSHLNVLMGEATIVEMDLRLYFDNLRHKTIFPKEIDAKSVQLSEDESLLGATLRMVANDSSNEVINWKYEHHQLMR